MAVEIGALRALLSLDSAAFEKGAKRAQASMNGLQKSLSQTADKLGAIGRKMTTRITLPLAGIAAVAVKTSLSTVDAQAKMAESLNTSVASMQALDRAAQLAGIPVSGLEQLSKDLTRRLSQAADSGGPAADALARLGLNAEDLLKIPLDQRIATINAAIEEFVPAAQRAAVAGKLFGEEGSIAASRLSPEVIAQANAELLKYGVIVSDIDAKQIEETNDAFTSIGLVTKGLANQLTVALAPTLKRIAEAIANVAGLFTQLSPEMKRLAGIAVTVAAAIGPLAIALGFVAAGLAALATPIGVVLAGLAVLAGAAVYVATQWSDLRAGLALTAEVAVEVFGRIKRGGALLAEEFGGFGMQIHAAFVRAFAGVVESFAAMTGIIADGWNGLMSMMGVESNAQGLGTELAETMRASADNLSANANEFQRSMNKSWADLTAPLESLNGLSTTMGEVGQSAQEAAEDVLGMGTAIEGMSNAAGAARGAADGIKGVQDSLSTVGKETTLQSQKLSDFFNNAIQGANSLSDVVEGLLSQLSSLFIKSGLEGIFGNTTIGDLLSFDGGGYTGAGARSGGVDGKGGFPAILHPNETVIDHSKGQGMGQSGGGNSFTFAIDARGADASAVGRLEVAVQKMATEFEGRVHSVLRTGRNTRRNKVWSGA